MYNLKSLQAVLVFCCAVGFGCLFWRMLGATCKVDQQPYSLRQAAQSLVLHYGLLETQRILKEIETAKQRQVKFTLLQSLVLRPNKSLSGHHGYAILHCIISSCVQNESYSTCYKCGCCIYGPPLAPPPGTQPLIYGQI